MRWFAIITAFILAIPIAYAQEVPEFSTITAGIALAGGVIG
jgi:hypothetical protein